MNTTRIVLVVLMLSLLCWLAVVMADQRHRLRGETARVRVAEDRVATLEELLKLCTNTKRLGFALDDTQRRLDAVWQ